MKFEQVIDGRTLKLIASEPGRWDGVPLIDTFLLDHVPKKLNSDRVAVAFVLLYGDLLGGTVDFPGTINAVTAGAVREFVDPVQVYISNIQDAPAKINIGDVELIVNRHDGIPKRNWISQQSRSLSLLSRDEHLGAISSIRGVTASSNASLFNKPFLPPNGDLAAAVLLAEEFNAERIVIDLDDQVHSFYRYYELLNSVGLKLSSLCS